MPKAFPRVWCLLALSIFAGSGSAIAAPVILSGTASAVPTEESQLIPVRDRRDDYDDDDDDGDYEPRYREPRHYEPRGYGGYARGYDDRYRDDDRYRRYEAPPVVVYDRLPYYRPAPLAPPPVPPAVVFDQGLLYAPPRPSSCGRYRYWNGDYCADARYERPYVGPRW